MFILCLAFFGCNPDHRDLTEYELDENSFGADTILKIEKESGVDIPDEAKGLKFHHIPPIDPIVFAKIQVPSKTGKLMEKRIKSLPDYDPFPKNFANDRCKWWPSNPKNVIVSKGAFNNGYYIEAHLLQEKEQFLFYIKYFTI